VTRTEHEAVDAFERLGLTRYEAKVFIALHRIGSGTAREVSEIVDVPRSQVYGVAERLEARGLVDVQQSTPIRYRPVGVEQARNRLRDRFESEQELAFEYVATVHEDPTEDETREDIWTIRGRERIDDRATDLLERATDRIVYGTRVPDFLSPAIATLLEDRASAGLFVTILSHTPAVRQEFESHAAVTTLGPQTPATDERSGRILLVDDDTLLLSVVDDDGRETAIWSSESLFASVLIQLIEVSIGLTSDRS
jgi:sugar-specific transcriptional regulator TrmB